MKQKSAEINVYVSRPLFWTITICLLLLPISMQYKILLWGVKTTGEVVPIQKIDLRQVSGRYRHSASIIHFDAGGQTVQIFGPENTNYQIGELIPIVYEKKNPQNCMVYSFSQIFFVPKTSIALILLIIWLAFYFSFAEKRKPNNLKK